MALSREKKEQLLKEYGERLGRAQVLSWARHCGLSVAEISDLRKQLRDSNAEAVVIRNTLMRITLEQAGWALDAEMMGGPALVTFIYDDIAPAARTLVNFARNREEQFQVTGGIIDGTLANVSQIRQLTTLPSRDVLLAQVVGGIQAPISGLVGTLAAVMRGVLNVLNARSDQLQVAEG